MTTPIEILQIISLLNAHKYDKIMPTIVSYLKSHPLQNLQSIECQFRQLAIPIWCVAKQQLPAGQEALFLKIWKEPISHIAKYYLILRGINAAETMKAIHLESPDYQTNFEKLSDCGIKVLIQFWGLRAPYE